MKPLRVGFLVLGFLALLGSNAFGSSDSRYVIRPGVGVGGIKLGMSDKDPLLKRIHAPTRITRLAHGILVERWLSPMPVAPHVISEKKLLGNYLTLFFEKDRLIQIEVSSESFHTPSGLSTASSASDFQKLFSHVSGAVFQDNITHDPTASLPAAKHFVAYEDAVKAGFAWKYGVWGGLASGPDPNRPLEALIVHLKGRKVIRDPNDSLPYSGTWPLTK